MNLTKNRELKEQLLQFSIQLVHRKVQFTACGLFGLNKKLIFTVCIFDMKIYDFFFIFTRIK